VLGRPRVFSDVFQMTPGALQDDLR
jgi:hypothetical protein